MMKYSELIRLRNEYQRIDLEGIIERTDLAQARLERIFEDHAVHENQVSVATEELNNARVWLDASKRTTSIFLSELNHHIAIQTKEALLIDESYWKDHGARFKTAEYVREFQQLPISKESEDIVRSRIGLYTDWRFPALEIGPGDGYWTKYLTACDPLYIADYNDEFLQSTKNSFNTKYQARLRCYLNQGDNYDLLPMEQFGFVFSWNTFNYFSHDQIYTVLADIYHLLREGGACMFSYNNVERPECAERAENQLMSFVLKSKLQQVLVDDFRFVDVKFTDTESTISWVEFRKRGELRSKRTGQTLGKIIPAPHVER